MKTIKVDILNPKARKILNNLADLDLIAIRKSTNKNFAKVLYKFRAKSAAVLSEEDIKSEVEAVRSKIVNR